MVKNNNVAVNWEEVGEAREVTHGYAFFTTTPMMINNLVVRWWCLLSSSYVHAHTAQHTSFSFSSKQRTATAIIARS